MHIAPFLYPVFTLYTNNTTRLLGHSN
uniref:Uncharacterized protein n=1 Tax=Anguilla anguilla TaxID=7936 RepID=A0A0E9SV62_ANGAN